MTKKLREVADEIVEKFTEIYNTSIIQEEQKLKNKTIQLKFDAYSKYGHLIDLKILIVEPELYYFEYKIFAMSDIFTVTDYMQ